jgi:type I restriction enzyme S subunit
MYEWREVRLRDLCESVDYGLTAGASPDPVGPKFLRITDIVAPTLDWSAVPFVAASEDQAEKYRLKSGDIVIARTGATTGYSRWLQNPPEAVFASYLVRLSIRQGIDSRFVGYLLKGEQFENYVTGVLGDKSAQPNASAKTLTNAVLRIPTARRTQAAIAELLGALDDKIANNVRVAVTLRALGSARFAEAKSRAGSRELRLGDVVTLLVRGIAPRYTVNGSGVPVLNQRCIRAGRVNTAESRWTVPAKVSEQKYLSLGDVLINSTGVGTLGRVARWAKASPATVDSHITIVRFSDEIHQICGAFALFAAQPEIESMGEGSTGQIELSRVKLGNLQIVLPAKEACEGLGALLEKLEVRGEVALSESVKLAELRDALLPKLMSGEIRVRDAEKAVEDVT